jgi:hypothetical protein
MFLLGFCGPVQKETMNPQYSNLDQVAQAPAYSFTYYPRLRDPQGSRHALTFAQLSEWLGKAPSFESKADAPLIGPGLYPGNTRRTGNEPEGAELLFLDIDAQPWAAVSEGLERLADKGYRFIVHTTYSHGAPGKSGVCLRLIFPLDRRVSRHEYQALSAWAWSQFPGVALDQTSGQITRAFYVPGCPQSRAQTRVFEVSDGLEPLHVNGLVARATAVSRAPEYAGPRVFSGEIIGHREMLTLAKRLQRAGIETQGPAIGRMIENGLCGCRYATDGARHAANVRISYIIGREFPHADPLTMAELFRVALERQGGKTVDEFARLIESAQRKTEQYEDWTLGLLPAKRSRAPKVVLTLRDGGAV